jgi:FkbH-like protein
MKYFVFRNATVERFFQHLNVEFSGYEDISVISVDADRYIWFYLAPVEGNKSIAEKIRHYADLARMTVEQIPAGKMFIIFTIKDIFTIQSISSDRTIGDAVNDYNSTLYTLASQYGNIKVIDSSHFLERYTSEELIDWKYYFLSQIPLNPKLADNFSAWFDKQVEFIELKRKKGIVLDLDNTLWSGILGEEGIEGIQMGETYPGNCYRFFQEYLLQLYHAGIILTVCSKNNENDVLEVWKKHPDCILRQEHFVTYRINWQNKADNIRDIAAELNIGLDSLIFVDDNPTERALVSQMLPQITVPDFPKQPYLFPKFCKSLTDNYFFAYELTNEDLTKTQQYKENTERKRFESSFTDFTSYLRSLEIELTIESLDNINIVRFAQMTQKTNQFNLTTKRYTESDLCELAGNGAMIFGLRMKDKFGDNGLTGLIIITSCELRIVEIDTFLLSCRILGKNIEIEFLQFVLLKLKKSGFQTILAKYIQTLKNAQVETFYEKLGFEIVKQSEEEKEYKLDLSNANYTLLDIYKIFEK